MQLKRSGQQLPVLPRAAPQAVDEHVGFVDQREHQRANLLRKTGDERPQGSLARHTQRQRQGPDAAFAILPLRGRGLRPSFDRARKLKHGVGIALQEPLPLLREKRQQASVGLQLSPQVLHQDFPGRGHEWNVNKGTGKEKGTPHSCGPTASRVDPEASSLGAPRGVSCWVSIFESPSPPAAPSEVASTSVSM